MADKEEGEETAPRGADWEVVSLTASTYAAAPGPDAGGPRPHRSGENKIETSNPLFMSDHFVFPPSQHENLPLEPENIEKGGKPFARDEKLKLTESAGIPFLEEYGESTTLPGANMVGKEESIYNSAKFHSEPILGIDDDDEDRVLVESSLGSNVPSSPNDGVEEKCDGSSLPYAAWWKKHAAALYAHAKESHRFWSIFIASAVMGLVLIGQHWQQERWKVLHNRWHSGIYDEKFGRIISRFKDAMVGGNHRQGFYVRGSREN